MQKTKIYIKHWGKKTEVGICVLVEIVNNLGSNIKFD